MEGDLNYVADKPAVVPSCILQLQAFDYSSKTGLKFTGLQMWKSCDFFCAKQNCEFLIVEVLLSLVPHHNKKDKNDESTRSQYN